MGGVFGKGDSSRHSTPASKLEAKMVEAMQKRAQAGSDMKSFNNIILKFPKIDQSLRNCKTIFQQFGESFSALDGIKCHLLAFCKEEFSTWLF